MRAGIDNRQLSLLLTRSRNGEKASFEALYRLTGQPLYALIFHLVKDEQWAADLLQEGFIKLWQDRSSYPIDYPWAWLCQCMRNLTLDALRSRHRRQEAPWDAAFDPLVTPEEKLPLDPCLHRLAPEKRNAIVLAYRHGLSHQEIVLHTRTPLGTVKSWIRRGLEELKQCLTQ